MSAWEERMAERSPIVRRSRDRTVQQARVLIDAALRLIAEKGENFTTHDLVKEAGVALQTFYRYFAGKDELLLAIIENLVADAAVAYQARASELDDPLDRLRSHIQSVVASLDSPVDIGPQARFIASEHWRLSRLFPDEIAMATKPYSDLLRTEIGAANEAGRLRSTDPDRDAWFIGQLVLSVFHHHSFAAVKDEALADDLWTFCLRALGGEIRT